MSFKCDWFLWILLAFRSCPCLNFFRRKHSIGRRAEYDYTINAYSKLSQQHSLLIVFWLGYRATMLLCRVSAVSQTLSRWGRRSHRGGGLLHRALSFSSSRCQAVSPGEGSPQPAEAGSPQGLYRDTVLLPRTDFPMKLTGQKLLNRELQIQQVQRTI